MEEKTITQEEANKLEEAIKQGVAIKQEETIANDQPRDASPSLPYNKASPLEGGEEDNHVCCLHHQREVKPPVRTWLQKKIMESPTGQGGYTFSFILSILPLVICDKW